MTLEGLIDPTALTQLQNIAAGMKAECILIGAAVWHAHGLSGPVTTEDIDFVVGLDLDNWPLFVGELTRHGWKQHPRREHEWHSPQEARVDLLPAGPQLRSQGYVTWPESGKVMSLVGFEHVFARACAFAYSPHRQIRVVDLPVYALLKVVAFLDRPAERGKDIEDLAALLERYEQDSDRFYLEPPLDLAYEERSAFLLGCDLATFCTEMERELIHNFADSAHLESGRLAWIVQRALSDLDGRRARNFQKHVRGLLQGFGPRPADR